MWIWVCKKICPHLWLWAPSSCSSSSYPRAVFGGSVSSDSDYNRHTSKQCHGMRMQCRFIATVADRLRASWRTYTVQFVKHCNRSTVHASSCRLVIVVYFWPRLCNCVIHATKDCLVNFYGNLHIVSSVILQVRYEFMWLGDAIRSGYKVSKISMSTTVYTLHTMHAVDATMLLS